MAEGQKIPGGRGKVKTAAVSFVKDWLIRPAHPGQLISSLLIPGMLICAAVLLYYRTVWDSIHDFVVAIDHCELLFCDFVSHFYRMGTEIFTLGKPVFGYFYSPLFALLLSILGLFSLDTATILWGILQLAAAGALCLIPGVYFIRKSKSLYYLHLFLFISALPVLHNLKWGQVSTFLVLGVMATLFLYGEKKNLGAALVLAICTSINYYTGIFVIYFALKKDFRFVTFFVLFICLFLLVVPVLILGPDKSLSFYSYANKSVFGPQPWIMKDSNSQYLASVICRLSVSTGFRACRSATSVIGYILFIINMAAVYMIIRKKLSEGIMRAFVLIFLSIPLIVGTSWPHYFVFLPFCQTYLIADTTEGAGSLSSKILRVIFLIVPSMILSSAFLFNLINDRELYNHYGCLFFSSLFLLIAFYFQNSTFIVGRSLKSFFYPYNEAMD